MSASHVLVLKGAERFELANELHITPAPKLCGTSGRFLRCLSIRRGTSLLTDIDAASHVVERRIDQLPSMHRLWFHPTGGCLGYRKSGRIGNPSELFFLNASGVLLRSVQLPDAVSDVEADPGPWYVGCRDSRLYAFETDGTLLWRRRVRVPAPYSIPGMFLQATAPYLNVAAGTGLVGIGAERRLYVLDRLGHQRWRAKLRGEPGVHETTWAPTEVPIRARLLDRLGLPADADPAKVRTGYLRLEWGKMGGGPVREMEQYDTEACTTAGACGGDGPCGFTVALSGGGRGGIRVMGMAGFQVAVGTEEGGVELFDGQGTLSAAFRVGDAPVSALCMDYAQLRATYAGGLLTLFEGGRISGFVQLPEYFATLAACGSEVLVWGRQEAWVVDRRGRVVWRASFSRRIGSVVAEPLGFQVLAGKLFWFQRRVD